MRTMLKNHTRLLTALALGAAFATQTTGCVALVAGAAATTAVSVEDRRATSTQWNDQEINVRVGNRISAKFGSDTHVNITSFNHSVLLSGEVPDDATRGEVERLARETPEVKQVYNELAVMLPSSLTSRAGDAALTTRVKARMIDAKRFSPVHVKVVSERKNVYLMGVVKRQEATDAAEITSQTPGVEKVVTLFEYED